jgi:4-hydroxy-2-oxoheptanedioate aldolase
MADQTKERDPVTEAGTAKAQSGQGAQNGVRPRLNKVIELIERGSVAFGPFLPAGSIPDAVFASGSAYDFVVYELEHNAFDLADLRLSLQFMLDRRQIREDAREDVESLRVVPFVRIPVNGGEQNEWIVKQVLDLGVFGIVFPMIETVEDARHALASMRYPQAAGVADIEPVGRRGHAPGNAIRYWGLTQPEYFDRADVWPLDPAGELLPILQCETVKGIDNLPAICRELKTPGLILISQGDLSVSLGCKGQYNQTVEDAVQRARAICQEHGVPYGTPQAPPDKIEQRIQEGFQFLMPGAGRDVSTLMRGRAIAGRGEGT